MHLNATGASPYAAPVAFVVCSALRNHFESVGEGLHLRHGAQTHAAPVLTIEFPLTDAYALVHHAGYKIFALHPDGEHHEVGTRR